MKLLILSIAMCVYALAQPGGGGVYPPPTKPNCTATRTTNCTPVDVAGTTTVPGTFVVGLTALTTGMWYNAAAYPGATDSLKIAAAVAAANAAGNGVVYIPSTMSVAATVPSPTLASNQNIVILDMRIGRTPGTRFGSIAFWPEARSNSGHYVSELEVRGKQNPGLVANTLSDGTAPSYPIANKMASFVLAANGDTLWQWVSDPEQKGSLGWQYQDAEFYQYANGGSGAAAMHMGLDQQKQVRFDLTPANFVQSTLTVTTCDNTTPIICHFSGPHNVIGVNVPMSITGNAAANGTWLVNYNTSTSVSLVGSTANGAVDNGTAYVNANQMRATLNVPRIKGSYEALMLEGVTAEVGVTLSQFLGVAYPGSHSYCTNCNTPASPGATCATGGDGAGAMAYYVRGGAICF